MRRAVLLAALVLAVAAGCGAETEVREESGEEPAPPMAVEPEAPMTVEPEPPPVLAEPPSPPPGDTPDWIEYPTVEPAPEPASPPAAAAGSEPAPQPPAPPPAPAPTPEPPQASPAPEPGDATVKDVASPTGQEIFASYCAACHGSGAEGQPGWRVRNADGTAPPPPLNGNGHASHHADGLLYRTVSEGMRSMPAFGDRLSHEEIIAAITHVKSLWGDSTREKQKILSEGDPFPDPRPAGG